MANLIHRVRTEGLHIIEATLFESSLREIKRRKSRWATHPKLFELIDDVNETIGCVGMIANLLEQNRFIKLDSHE